jgi:hydrogenase maturation protease
MTPSVLVAGIGNIFLGDDGFGVEVVTRLTRLTSRTVPDGVRVADFGIRGVHLAYELLDGYDVLVLIDAMPMGELPGTLAVIEPDPVQRPDLGDDVAPVVDAHSMNPGVVLGMLAGLGGTVERIVIVGCEPASLDEGIGLSQPVAGSVDAAVDLCVDVLAELFETAGKETRP